MQRWHLLLHLREKKKERGVGEINRWFQAVLRQVSRSKCVYVSTYQKIKLR